MRSPIQRLRISSCWLWGIAANLVLSTLENEEERILIKPLESDPLGVLVARLNHLPVLHRPWAGLCLLDVPGQPGPWVLQADETAVKAGIQRHQAITRVDGKPVANAVEFKNALLQAKGERVKVGQGSADFELPLYLVDVELPISDPTYSYPFLLAELRLRLLGARGEAAAMLRFQQALALLHFRKHERAVELLRDIRSLRSAGVGQGTIEYYMGLCLVRLGSAYSAEAIQAFSQALKYPAATLFGPEGPLLAPLAKQAIEDNKLN